MKSWRPFSGGLTDSFGDTAYMGDRLTAGEKAMVNMATADTLRLAGGKMKSAASGRSKAWSGKDVEMQTEEYVENGGEQGKGWPAKVAGAVMTDRMIERELEKTMRRQMPTIQNTNADYNFNELYAYMGRLPLRIPVLPDELQKEIKTRTITDYDKEVIMNEPVFRSFEAKLLIKHEGDVPGVLHMSRSSALKQQSAIKIQSLYRGYKVRKPIGDKIFGRKAPLPETFGKTKEPFVFDLLVNRATSKGHEESKLPIVQRRLIDRLRNLDVNESEVNWELQAKSEISDEPQAIHEKYRGEAFNFDEIAKNLAEIDRLNKETHMKLYDDNPSIAKKSLIDIIRKGADEDENRSSIKKSRNLRWKDLSSKEKIKTEGSVPENLDEIEIEIATARSSRRDAGEFSQSMLIGRKISPKQSKNEYFILNIGFLRVSQMRLEMKDSANHVPVDLEWMIS